MNPLIDAKLGEVVRLCRRFRVRRLELFGSTARDQFDPETSDLDFLVEFEPAPPREHAACYFGLLFGLEDLFQRKVDLVETAAISNPYFLRAIAHDRRVLYAA